LMLVIGERVSDAAIRHAWRDLQRAGICASSEWEKASSSAPRPARIGASPA
jgi:hypothetical protein